jgi:LysM repeat protein
MDTISRENNSSMLPVGGIIVGVIGLLLGVFALVQASKANKAVAENQAQFASKIETVEQQAGSAAASAEKVSRELAVRMREVQDGFNTIGPALASLQASVTKLEESQKRPAAADKKGNGGPVVAGPGEYVIKPGDSFAKIGRAQGFSIADIQAVNPGVDSSNLKVGQKIKLPQKR